MAEIERPSRVLLIGWDGADWKIIHRLVDAGMMPNMASFIEQGVIGNLATLYPELSPMLWTSIATGKRPYKHGILGFIEPDPHAGGVRPITNISRKTKAIWNILNQNGMKSNVIAWWPSHPVEPVNGVMVSNHYQRAVAPHGKPWPVKPSAIHPERLIRNLAPLRVHPQELDVGLIMNFLPRLAEIDQEEDKRVENLAKIIADVTTVNKAATAIMHHEPWDFTAVYYDGIDHFCHGFMNYHPPRLPMVSETDFELYQNVVDSGYIYHDILLGTLLEKAGPDAVTIIVSDHGFHSDHLRPVNIPKEPAGPAVQHRPYGIFAAKGPGIKADEILYGASLLDICPTILTLFGLPVGEDMDGKPLVNIFETPPKIEAIPNWDEVKGEDGGHPPDMKIDVVETREAIDQLVELGYIERPDQNREQAAQDTMRELDYNLARSYMDAGLHVEAVPILEKLLEQWPNEYRFGIQLVSSLEALGRVPEARRHLEALFARKQVNARDAAEKLKKFQEDHKDTQFKDWDEKEQKEFRDLRAEASRSPYAMEYLMGSLLFEEGDEEKALTHLQRAAKVNQNQPDLLNKLGNVYIKMKRWQDAEAAFKKALEVDLESAEAHLGLCETYLGMKRNMDAAETALDTVGLRFHNAKAHYLLGTALHRIGRVLQAVKALNIAVAQNPNYPEAHRRLAYIYKNRLKDEKLAEEHRSLAAEAGTRLRALKRGEAFDGMEKDEAARTALTSDQADALAEPVAAPAGPVDLSRTVVVISGLPRSGTSMMMQMLAGGGVEPLTDGKREADTDNPKGYFEFEKVKALRRDASWVMEAKGHAVKVIAQLLRHLPGRADLDYRVIFMDRPLDHVVASQHAMLRRKKAKAAALTDSALKGVFSTQVMQVRQMLAARKIPTLFVDYDTALTSPADVVGRINGFLGGGLDEAGMALAVDPAMKRQGKGSG